MTLSSSSLPKKFQRLVALSHDLAATYDLEVLLHQIIQAAVELSNAKDASILLYDEDNHRLTFHSATNREDEKTLKGMLVPEDSIAGWVALNRQAQLVTDVHQDARYFKEVEQAVNYPTRNLIALPMIAKEKLIGVLEVLNKTEGAFTCDDQEILQALSAYAAIAIENSRLFHQSNLIADFVHELRTPLASITTAASLLQRPNLNEAQQAEFAQIILHEAQRLNNLASSFLDLASLESGRNPLKITPINLSLLVKDCVRVIYPQLQEKQLELEISSLDHLPELPGDYNKLKQVLLNLFSNSIKYNRHEGKVALFARLDGNGIEIRVEDNGVGIPDDEIPHLFEKFFRARNVEKEIAGTGLGLSICKRIIESHHGTIEIKSKLEQGTVVRLWLPCRIGCA